MNRKELRDYYAAEAMNGLVAGSQHRLTANVNNVERLAIRAFEIADAMLEESDRREVPAQEFSGPGPFVTPDN